MRKCIANYLNKINNEVFNLFDEDVSFKTNLTNYINLYNKLDIMYNEVVTMYWSDFINYEEQAILQDAIYDAKDTYAKLLENLAVENNA